MFNHSGTIGKSVKYLQTNLNQKRNSDITLKNFQRFGVTHYLRFIFTHKIILLEKRNNKQMHSLFFFLFVTNVIILLTSMVFRTSVRPTITNVNGL